MAGLKAQPAPIDGTLRRLRVPRDLRRQHARAGACSSPAIRGRRIRAAISTTTRSALPAARADRGSRPTRDSVRAAPHSLIRGCGRAAPAPLALCAAADGALAERAPAAGRAQRCTQQHCASCHGADRLGGMGPALLPENLERLKQRRRGRAVIAKGRAATQMPAFARPARRRTRSSALAGFVYAPVDAAAGVGRGGDRCLAHRVPSPPAACPTARSSTRRSAESLRRRRSRRPPRHDPGRRPLRAARALRHPLRPARRAEVHARRALRVLRARATAG